jgi:hypothetical protein
MKERGQNFRIIIERQNADLVQTLGTLYIVDDADVIQFKCWSLELPARDNKTNISRIPAGTYPVVKRWSKKYGNHLHINDVEGRSMILIHPGNTFLHTKGCILVGNDLGYINGDEHLDVLNSKVTMNEILKLMPAKSEIMIVENELEDSDYVVKPVE